MSRLCGLRINGWHCTRPADHEDDHVATIGVYAPGLPELARQPQGWNPTTEPATLVDARLTPHDEGKASGSATDTSSSSAPQPPQERTGWQPIETAPRDYRVRILVYDAAWCGGNPRITATNWVGYRTSDGKTVEKKGSFSGVTRPTHWMPLPDPPPDLIPRDERTTDGSSSSSQESGQTQDVGRK